MNTTPTPEPTRDPSADPPRTSTPEAATMPVLREVLEVQTEKVHTGTLRVRKVVHERPENVSAPGYRDRLETRHVLREEAVSSERPPWQDGETLVIPVYAERWVRQLFLIEEIQVTRHREQVDEGGPVSLRWEEVIVERLDPETRQWTAQAPPAPR